MTQKHKRHLLGGKLEPVNPYNLRGLKKSSAKNTINKKKLRWHLKMKHLSYDKSKLMALQGNYPNKCQPQNLKR